MGDFVRRNGCFQGTVLGLWTRHGRPHPAFDAGGVSAHISGHSRKALIPLCSAVKAHCEARLRPNLVSGYLLAILKGMPKIFEIDGESKNIDSTFLILRGLRGFGSKIEGKVRWLILNHHVGSSEVGSSCSPLRPLRPREEFEELVARINAAQFSNYKSFEEIWC